MKKTNEILKLFNIRANKKLGQNFLLDEKVLKQIASSADISKDDLVIEIGPGIGSLTQYLCEKAKHVVAVEIDDSFLTPLKYVLDEFSNCDILIKDVLEIDIRREIIDKYKDLDYRDIIVISNLPYYITTPIINKFLKLNDVISKMVFMVQKEVANRIVSKEGSKDYGILSIAVQIYSQAEYIFEVTKEKFYPSPKVDSAVILLDVYKDNHYGIENYDDFFCIIKAAFCQRRKTLVNSLNAGLKGKVSKKTIKHILIELELNPKIRAEKISIENFVALVNKIVNYL